MPSIPCYRVYSQNNIKLNDGLDGQGASKKYHEQHNLNQNVQGGNERRRGRKKVRLNVLFICQRSPTLPKACPSEPDPELSGVHETQQTRSLSHCRPRHRL